MSVNLFVTAAFILIISVTISAFPLKLSLLAEDGMFEGDLKITESFIRTHYNLSEMNGTELSSDRSRRAVASNSKLWVDGIVPYAISRRISSSKHAIIHNAMDRLEDTTCLRFVRRERNNRDYIYFQDTNHGCYSNSVGRKGGKQAINLQRGSCEKYGIILHEIAHAIGFWHEQSRPDRDEYVRIIDGNIQSGEKNEFMKRIDFEIDYQGSSYDYGSIMHYQDTAFVKDSCKNCKTIEVSNKEAYKAQGSPRLGLLSDLSSSDIQQANRLYSCSESGAGVAGTLTVKVRYGRNLKDTDWLWDLPDPFVQIIAVDHSGIQHRNNTDTKTNTRNPVWNETFRFSRSRWQFFRIRVWDSDWGTDGEAMSMSETVIIAPGSHRYQKHCDDTECSGYVKYDYRVV